MHRECRERFPRHRLQRKPLDSDPGVPLYMAGSLTRGGGETFPAFPAYGKMPYPLLGKKVRELREVPGRGINAETESHKKILS